MWKKDEAPPQTPAATPRANPAPQRESVSGNSSERATIGRSITIKGEVTGDEDLLIQGRVNGSVTLKKNSVTVGPEGEVKADITGRVVTVEGNVEGNVTAQEQVILLSSAWVQGDISAPRIVLEDGARFRGGVDMGEAAERGGASKDGANPSNRLSGSPSPSTNDTSAGKDAGAAPGSTGSGSASSASNAGDVKSKSTSGSTSGGGR